jgi:hypothetical protein
VAHSCSKFPCTAGETIETDLNVPSFLPSLVRIVIVLYQLDRISLLLDQ